MQRKSHFYAYISKIKGIVRWGLKRNLEPENVMEHSWEVATIAHALAIIKNKHFGGNVDINAVATAALYHDCIEVITGDMPSPLKYHSTDIQQAYKTVEKAAESELLQLLPETLRAEYEQVLIEDNIPKEQKQLIKAADTIQAFLKCQAELRAGNQEFTRAAEDILGRLKAYGLPEVDYFINTFVPSYQLSLDDLLNDQDKSVRLSDSEKALMGLQN